MAQDFSRVMNMARTAWGRKTYSLSIGDSNIHFRFAPKSMQTNAFWQAQVRGSHVNPIQSNPIPIRLDPKTVARWTTCNKWPGRGALKTSPDDLGVPAGTTLMRNLQGEAGGEHISISLQSGLIYSTTWQCFISYVQAKFGKMLETFH